MKALMWKDVFASLNPSPVFEVVATLAEELAIKDGGRRKVFAKIEPPHTQVIVFEREF